MSIAEKLTTIAENEQKVHDAGYNKGIADQKAISVDWDVVQDSGNRKYWTNAFSYWGAEDISPKYLIAPNTQPAQGLIMGCTKLKTVDWDKFDLTKCTTLQQAFNSCFELQSIDTDLAPKSATANVWQYTFSGCRKAKRIQKIISQLTHEYLGSFATCYALEEIRFAPYDADIGIGIGNNISFTDSPKLTRESIESICMALANVEGKTLTFSTEVGLDAKLKPFMVGNGMRPFYEGTKTVNGITFTPDEYGAEISVKGTATGGASYRILAEPITVKTSVGAVAASLLDSYDWLPSNYLKCR